MERRRANRLTVNLKAERLSCTKNCSVFIENLSETGISMITSPSHNNIFEPGSGINIKLKLSNGDTIKLNCNVKWSYDNSAEDMTNSVGLEIVDPPAEYKDFLKTLH
jgi:hypothetical protein